MPIGTPKSSARNAAMKLSSSVAGIFFFEDDLPDRLRLLIGETEISLRRMADEAGELHHETVVQPQFLAQPLTVGEAGVLADHVGDRVANVVEQRKGDQSHDQHHQHRLQETLDDEGEHFATSSFRDGQGAAPGTGAVIDGRPAAGAGVYGARVQSCAGPDMTPVSVTSPSRS